MQGVVSFFLESSGTKMEVLWTRFRFTELCYSFVPRIVVNILRTANLEPWYRYYCHTIQPDGTIRVIHLLVVSPLIGNSMSCIFSTGINRSWL